MLPSITFYGGERHDEDIYNQTNLAVHDQIKDLQRSIFQTDPDFNDILRLQNKSIFLGMELEKISADFLSPRVARE